MDDDDEIMQHDDSDDKNLADGGDGNGDNDGEQEEDQDFLTDDTPEFLRPGDDAIEVVVDDAENKEEEEEDDDDVPMDDDEQDEEGAKTATIDMSNIQYRSHTGPVYAVAADLVLDDNQQQQQQQQQLFVLSGGGDDRAVFQDSVLSHAHTDSVAAVALNTMYVQDKTKKTGGDATTTTQTTTPNMAAVGGYDGAIVLYDIPTGKELFQLEGPTDVEFLVFHPLGGTVLLAGSANDGTLWMYHVSTNNPQCLQVFVGHEAAVSAGAFSNNGKNAVSCSADGTLRVWAPKTGVCKHVFRFPSSSGSNEDDDDAAAGLTSLALQPNSTLAMVGSEDGRAHICNIATKKIVGSLRHAEDATAAAASMSMANDDDYDDDDEQVAGPAQSVEAVGFCPTLNWCATAGMDGNLKIWDLNNLQCRQICSHDGVGLTKLAWHETLPVVMVASVRGTVSVWDARNGQLLQTLTTGSSATINDMDVVFENNNNNHRARIVTGSDDHVVRVFDVDIASLLQTAS